MGPFCSEVVGDSGRGGGARASLWSLSSILITFIQHGRQGTAGLRTPAARHRPSPIAFHRLGFERIQGSSFIDFHRFGVPFGIIFGVFWTTLGPENVDFHRFGVPFGIIFGVFWTTLGVPGRSRDAFGPARRPELKF